MKNQYKIEVGQISLSDSFKQGLKDKMAAEYASQAKLISTKKSFNFSKYSKYIATAACLALIVATVSVVSAINGGFKLEKTADSMFALEDSLPENSMVTGEDAAAFDIDDAPVEDAVEDEAEEAIAVEEPVEDVAVEEPMPSSEEEAEDMVEETIEDAVEPAADSNKSIFAPENYDGEYFAEDYVLASDAEPIYEEVSVVEVFDDTDKSYNELCSQIEDMDEVGFAKFTITEIVSAEDANSITGNESFSDENTMYRAELIYDYLTNASASGEIYVVAYGNETVQQKGFPTFAVDDVILAGLDTQDGYVELVEEMVYVVHRINGVDIAYHLLYENVDPGDTNMGLLDMESEIVTTTDNNPAIYTHKAAVKELTRYVRRNFEKREFTFADMTSVDAIEEVVPDDETPVEDSPVTSEATVDISKIKFLIGTQKIDPKGHGSALRSYSNSATGTNIGEATCSVSFGKNVVTFEGTSPYGGKIVSIEVNELGNNMMMFTLNNLSIGSSWEYAISVLGLDITPADNATVTVSVMSGEEVAYYITVTVENGVISQILFA